MFKDRYDAAQQLLASLQEYKNRDDVVILAIPRGALEIGSVLARELHAPLDVIFTKKIGAPGQPELAIGSVGLDVEYINPYYKKVYPDYIEQEKEQVRTLLKERYQKYRGDRPAVSLRDKVVILVDDGIATGSTVLLALDEIKKQKPKKVIVAIPVGPHDALELVKQKADKVICLLTPDIFWAISQFYQNFPQVGDEQAITFLREAQL